MKKSSTLKAVPEAPKRTTAEIDRADMLAGHLGDVQAVLVALNMASESDSVPEPFASALMNLTGKALADIKEIKALVDEVTA